MSRFANGKAQTRSLSGSTESWIKDVFDDVVRHPATRILNGDHRAVAPGLRSLRERNRDAPARFGMSDGVTENVQNDLPDGIFVAQYEDRARR